VHVTSFGAYAPNDVMLSGHLAEQKGRQKATTYAAEDIIYILKLSA
jgi:hypothetical protein